MSNNNYTELGYFVYNRKSSEGEEKQVLSIESQKEKNLEIFSGLKIVDVLEERKSAFVPYQRPVFASMIERIRNGEAQGIIAWHPDRLSRNEIDAGEISYLVRTGIIKDLKFGSYFFDNSPEGIMMLQMALTQSQYSSAKLSKDVKRGLEKKISMGWMPGLSPAGYLNDKFSEKGDKKIIKDPERFTLIRRMWDLMLTGNYTPPRILEIANNEWGYRTVKRKREGGGLLSRSAIYKIFTNPFYAGIVEYAGKQSQGKHEPMITLEEFDRVQTLLGRKGKPRPKKHRFALTGMIRCAECGCLYTAEKKYKHIKSTGKVKYYTYYHCTRKRTDMVCSQRKVLREDELEKQIEQELDRYTILPEFRDWALEALKSSHHKETDERNAIFQNQQKTLVEIQAKEDKLIDMRCSDLIDDEQYQKKKEEIQKQKAGIKEQLKDTEHRTEKWLELTEKTFDFATYARIRFAEGDAQAKKEILSALGQNPIVKDGKLVIQANEWFQPIKKEYPALLKEFAKLEPNNLPINKAKTEALASVRTRWLPGQDSNL